MHIQLLESRTPKQRSRFYDSLAKMTSALVRLLNARGLKFEAGEEETLSELLSRISKDQEQHEEPKQVEETIKDLAKDVSII